MPQLLPLLLLQKNISFILLANPGAFVFPQVQFSTSFTSPYLSPVFSADVKIFVKEKREAKRVLRGMRVWKLSKENTVQRV